MPLMTIGKCFRNRKDCQSFHVIEATPDNATEDQILNLDFKPASFVCCGCITPDKRVVPQDAYRVCFKNDAVDDMSDNDEQDLVHLVTVIMTALAVIASRRVHRGYIDVPASIDEGALVSVNTQQGVVPA
jgi:hypothetical protein